MYWKWMLHLSANLVHKSSSTPTLTEDANAMEARFYQASNRQKDRQTTQQPSIVFRCLFQCNSSILTSSKTIVREIIQYNPELDSLHKPLWEEDRSRP